MSAPCTGQIGSEQFSFKLDKCRWAVGIPHLRKQTSKRVRDVRAVYGRQSAIVIRRDRGNVDVVGFLGVSANRAAEVVDIRLDLDVIDLSGNSTDLQTTEGDRIVVLTALGADGIERRIEVPARETGTDWAVLALANNSSEALDELLA